ncbi:Cytb5 Cytochrome b5 [Candida maltosa Xu316]|uniref:Cytochrome B5, putative n=1 Tax=Candida maltosa (strain Xu316) TaxID=1245528 RepID=M3J5J5_CANMX|nr:Cytochrome B5, putative [Candida maltosa Xu316]
MSDTTTTVYDYEEISKHKTHDDLWVVLNGKVYDITSYIDEHPGGEEVIIDVAGTDATEAFDDIGHSDEAHEILQKLYIGNLKGAKPVAAKHAQDYATQDGGLNLPLIAVGIFLAGFAAYYYATQIA